MSRIPGTYEKGDRVRVRVPNGVEGTVFYDNRKDGGCYVYVEWDNDKGAQISADPEQIISAEAGRFQL